MAKEIKFDKAKLQLLKQEYEKAHNRGKKSFVFEGSELLTSYAKYLIEFLKDQLGE
jgi:hypothetical protein